MNETTKTAILSISDIVIQLEKLHKHVDEPQAAGTPRFAHRCKYLCCESHSIVSSAAYICKKEYGKVCSSKHCSYHLKQNFSVHPCHGLWKYEVGAG